MQRNLGLEDEYAGLGQIDDLHDGQRTEDKAGFENSGGNPYSVYHRAAQQDCRQEHVNEPDDSCVGVFKSALNVEDRHVPGKRR